MNTPDPLPANSSHYRDSKLSTSVVEAPAYPSRPNKIQPWHLERLAIVYVRQSSQYQVIHNKESAEVQSGFRNLALAWGWPSSRVNVIDHDQAQTGTSVEARTGFQWILTEVNLNHVGIILGFQVSRLSRANSDWYHLLERCAIFHTLLADMDGIYDPTVYNDRLLLGLKGTMSEAELHFLGQRLYESRLNKARRGEQFTSAPIGYIRATSGNQLELDPDEQVQHVVRLIFDKFDELGSIGAVLHYLVRHDIKLGFRLKGGPDAGALQWRGAVRPTLNKIFRHPYYAGCYAFGFRRLDRRRQKPGRPRTGMVQVERLKWEVMIRDAVPAYITWERYLANQERLTANRCLPATAGVPRGGPSLLSGVVYCGKCGRRMRVAYHAQGTPVYYMCNSRSVARAEPVCQSLAGNNLESLVTAEVLRVLEPAGLELHEQAVADLDRERQRLNKHWQQRLERAWIQADRAARQYHANEPENRLVARELERRWEKALEEQRAVAEQYDRFQADRPRELTAADRRRIEALAMDIPALWHSPGTTIQQRQTVVRYLVERITVTVRGRTEWVDVTIRWAGGMESRHEFRRPVSSYEQISNYSALRDRMVELRSAGATTEKIAEQLNREGFHPPHGADEFNRHVVNAFLVRQRILGPRTSKRVSDEELRRHEWRLDDLARELGMPSVTLRDWYQKGWVMGRKSAKSPGAWIFWADRRELKRLRRLRAWKRGGYNQKRPAELVTPCGPERSAQNKTERTSQHSGRAAAKIHRPPTN
jgi:DNA invertase Pin-like site-specific DNA recombinase